MICFIKCRCQFAASKYFQQNQQRKLNLKIPVCFILSSLGYIELICLFLIKKTPSIYINVEMKAAARG
jgi:hypothetical protein